MVTPIPEEANPVRQEDVRAVDITGGGLSARVLTWGATLQSLQIDGQDFSVILGSQELRAYQGDLLYFGAIVGPVANRIAGGRFALNGQDHSLERNENGRTTLHGGSTGFAQRNWSLIRQGDDFVMLGIEHPEGLGGFPGPMAVEVSYRLLADHCLEVELRGQSDKVACFSPAFHGYWNLDGAGDILSNRLTVDADRFTPVNDQLLPLGHTASVAGTEFDYREPRTVSPDLDHNFCVGRERGEVRRVALLEGRVNSLVVESTEPGLQVYTAGATSSGPWPGLDGRPFGRNAGIAIEPQLWPDAPNNPGFPSARIEPGQHVTQISRFRLIPN